MKHFLFFFYLNNFEVLKAKSGRSCCVGNEELILLILQRKKGLRNSPLTNNVSCYSEFIKRAPNFLFLLFPSLLRAIKRVKGCF